MRHARKWFVAAGVIGVVGLLVAACGLLAGDFSARGYVADRYQRAAAQDIGNDAKAYTSDRPPSEVANDITGQWAPADRYVDGSGVYLRYADDAIVILPLALGSLILIESMRTAYPRYYGIIGGYWGWGSGWGERVRGGGPGGGK
jgi:hypothetical protein